MQKAAQWIYSQRVNSRRKFWVALCASILALLRVAPCRAAETNLFTFARSPSTRYQFNGFAGERIAANIQNWLIPMPEANPGLITMFEVRDRQPAPNLVPWAGEFVGKYLISGIQTLRMQDTPELRKTIDSVGNRFIATQAEDGYLGPFRKEERLRGHWDLWGHYHAMLALLMWHESTGSTNALQAARRAGDLVCATYLDSGRRPFDAGSDEMNLAIIHSLGWLYRITGEERYFRMMREIEKDWECGGDYLRSGLAGTEFFQTRRPRWESLHNIQGLVELYRITGDRKYRDAFEHHWRSIARWDLRNTGGFSSGEQATGNPYSPTPIETCCTIAWMAMSTDMLALNGESKVADLLELATFNAWAGAQHPSGHWCTYNTPMDGVREASAHSIVFQSRHGTPELNCCSVNGPRGWGMLSEWAYLQSADGFVINWLAPGNVVFTETFTNFMAQPASATKSPQYEPLAFATRPETQDGVLYNERRRVFWISGNYPVETNVEIRVENNFEEEFTLRIRIPEWSRHTRAWLNDRELPAPEPGKYLAIRRKWQSHWSQNDVVKLALDMVPRIVPGAREASGKVSVYRGPILLAADQRFNSFDELPALDPATISRFALEPPAKTNDSISRVLNPLLVARVRANSGWEVRLCDFASAGAAGTRYWSWLPATNAAPAPVVTRIPRDSSTIPTGTVLFRWTKPPTNSSQALQIGDDPNFHRAPLLELPITGREALVQIGSNLTTSGWHYWRIVTSNHFGINEGNGPYARFRIDPTLPPANETLSASRSTDAQGNIVSLDNRLSFDGTDRQLFEIGEWPEENYSVSFRFKLNSFPTNRIGQLFSAWASPMDDPLRVTIDAGKISARIEAGGAYSTQGVPVEVGKWYDVSAIKVGSKLKLLLNGQERASCTVPEFITTRATDFALGGNPHFTGIEFVSAQIEKLRFRGE